MEFDAEPTQAVKRPFLKWAGSKTKLVKTLALYFPSGKRRYVEPFVGAGAVFLNTNHERTLLCDTNVDLIELYRILKQEQDEFVQVCKKLFTGGNNDEETFYKLRKEFNRSKDLERRSALFVYLNRHCFNGLCRYNSSGEFNSPFGRYDRPYFPEKEMLQFGMRLQTAELKHQDFRKTFSETSADDLIYCDPPYVALSRTANFTSYAAGGFSVRDQANLAELARKAASKGAAVLISNHDTTESRELYPDAIIKTVMVSRTISCDGKNRNKVKELIAVFEPGKVPAAAKPAEEIMVSAGLCSRDPKAKRAA